MVTIEEINAFVAEIEKRKPIILVHPDEEESVRALLHSVSLDTFVRLQTSPYVSKGTVIAIPAPEKIDVYSV